MYFAHNVLFKGSAPTMARRRMSPGSLLLSSLATILVVETMLMGGVDSFATGIFCPSLGRNINIKLSDAVGATSQGKSSRGLVQAHKAASPAAAASATVEMVAQRAGVPLRCSSALLATAGSCTTQDGHHWFGAQRGLPLSDASLRDRLDRDHG
ncbi:unnamed protein product, partial [Laminaria digitata]